MSDVATPDDFPGEGARRAFEARQAAGDSKRTQDKAADDAKTALAAANASQVAKVEAAARIADGVVSGADQDAVDQAVRDVKSGTASAADALTFLAQVYDDNKYKLALTGEDSDGGEEKDGKTFEAEPGARGLLEQQLREFGLAELTDFVWSEYLAERVDPRAPQSILSAVRTQDAYKSRFKANAIRLQKGLGELDPGEYLELERQYKNIMRQSGLPASFYDQQSDFENFIANDISARELESRIVNGYAAVQNADPQVRTQLRRLYDIQDQDLAAYFLDPSRAEAVLKTRAQAAKIAARGQETAGIALSSVTAEELVGRGFTEDEAQAAFTKIKELGELGIQFAGEETISEAEQIGAAFGYDVAAKQKQTARLRGRLVPFLGGGQFASTRGATSGTVESAVGLAQ